MDFQNELNRLQEMLNFRNSNQDSPVDLYDLKGSDEGDNEIDSLTMEPFDTLLMGDKVISTTPERENDEFIKSSIDDLVPIPKESEVTLVCDDLECDMHITIPLPTTDVREENFDINSPLGEYVVDFLMENVDVADLPRSYDVTFLNSLFDFNDDFILCNDNPLFDEEFEDISSLDPPELTLVIDELSANVNEVINVGQWRWPPEWDSKYPTIRHITVPNLDNGFDRLVWKNTDSKEEEFSVATVWNCIRPRVNEVDFFFWVKGRMSPVKYINPKKPLSTLECG
ncbi:hypothetical protein Tco_0809277 [Tanacetum coccineum]